LTFDFSSGVPRVLKITLAYDGTRYVGWQRQAAGTSIQGLLEEALARFEGGPVAVHGAGRTDAGVHALGQVASAQVAAGHDISDLRRGLNASLPPDVRVLQVEDAAPDFHARFSARSKTYRYVIRNAPLVSPFEYPYVCHVPERLDVNAMQAAASMLIGTHDFTAFRSAGSEVKDSVRTITRSSLRSIEVVPSDYHLPATSYQPGLLIYEVEASGFLRHMVRAIAGTLLEVGRGWRATESIGALIEGGRRADAGATAPPHGLFLVSVTYD
jgi:tRNA pseudouridine38-40 synthase